MLAVPIKSDQWYWGPILTCITIGLLQGIVFFNRIIGWTSLYFSVSSSHLRFDINEMIEKKC